MIKALDTLSLLTGRAISWLTLAMVVVTFLVVVLRYLFSLGWVWMQESVVWMHAFVFLIGAAYTLQKDDHVRVDIFYREMSETRRALVDALGAVILLLPFCAFVIWSSWDYVMSSWRIGEGSREAGGLPYPFTPLLKSAILGMAGLVACAGLAQLLRSVLVLTGRSSGGPDPHNPSQL